MSFVYCADNNVVDLLLVSAYSLREFTDEEIIILSNNINEENISKIFKTISNIKLIDISSMLEEKIVDSSEIDRKISKTSMAWILIPEITSIKGRVVQMDCDTLIVSPELVNYKYLDMEGKTFAAVPEIISGPTFKKDYQFDWLSRSGVGFNEHSSILGIELIDYNNYVNSGIVIIDTEKMREKNYSDKMCKWHMNNLRRPFNDQDILNSVASGDIKMLSVHWNYCKATFGSFWPYDDIKKFNSFSINAYVIHYAGKYAKPMSENCDGTYPFLNEYIEIYEKIFDK